MGEELELSGALPILSDAAQNPAKTGENEESRRAPPHLRAAEAPSRGGAAGPPPTLEAVSEEPVPEHPGVEVERVSVLRPEEVRML